MFVGPFEGANAAALPNDAPLNGWHGGGLSNAGGLMAMFWHCNQGVASFTLRVRVLSLNKQIGLTPRHI